MNIIIESAFIIWCLIYDYIAWLGAWFLDDQLLLMGFGPYGIIFMILCYKCCHDNDVERFWALWYNIYDTVFTV
jgi:hypothetical protein